MKIICITGGTGSQPENSKEWYTLPDSTLLRSNNPFFIPEFDSEFEGIPMLAIRIDRLGKNIASKFASRYYKEATAAVCVVAKNLLENLKKTGKPWSRAVTFDRSCLMGNFFDKSILLESESVRIVLSDREYYFSLHPAIEAIDEIIAEVSSDNTLKTGDIVLISLTQMGMPLRIGETMHVSLPEKNINFLTIRMR